MNNLKLTNKKGQAEIMGLLLIVILVAVGFMFYIKFAINKESSNDNLVQDFKETDLGNSFVNALIDSSITCGPSSSLKTVDLKLVLGDVASLRRKGICANNAGASQEKQVHDYLEKNLENTLGVLGVNYNLTILVGTTQEVSILQGYTYTNPSYQGKDVCNIKNRAMSHSLSSGTIALRNSAQQIFVRLLICS